MTSEEKWAKLLPKVLKFVYTPRPYPQSSLSNFVPFMSIVDAYLNLEKNLAIETIHGGFIELKPVT